MQTLEKNTVAPAAAIERDVFRPVIALFIFESSFTIPEVPDDSNRELLVLPIVGGNKLTRAMRPSTIYSDRFVCSARLGEGQ
jgi:hypothetical protein